MSLGQANPGFSSAAEFQVAALPWLTSSTAPSAGSPVRFDFGKVSSTITVSNRDTTPGNSLSVAFTRNGIVSGTGGMGQQKFIVNGGASITFNVRVKSMWLQGEGGTPAYSVYAGLTTIDANMMPELTGSNWANIG